MQNSATLFIVQIKLTRFGHKYEEQPWGRTQCLTVNLCSTCILLLSFYHGHQKPLMTSNIKFCSCQPPSNSVESHILLEHACSEFGKSCLHRHQHKQSGWTLYLWSGSINMSLQLQTIKVIKLDLSKKKKNLGQNEAQFWTQRGQKHPKTLSN